MDTTGTIREVHNPWRDGMLPATFDGYRFFVESTGRESGRRVVVHEYPKAKNGLLYSEDMGQRAVEFTVRGYCIQFMNDAGYPFLRDYRIARDVLQDRLDAGGEGYLQLPYMLSTGPMLVVCPRYRMTEEERFGGYAVFDMTFVEFGQPPSQPVTDSNAALNDAASKAMTAITSGITNPTFLQSVVPPLPSPGSVLNQNPQSGAQSVQRGRRASGADSRYGAAIAARRNSGYRPHRL
jgi:prophage DNA circulation protein